MKFKIITLFYTLFSSLIIANCLAQEDYTKHVNRFMGSAGDGAVTPAAAVPFGMVQCGPNNHKRNSGYHYDQKNILGFSHVNKSGGGCNDFLDILFVPLNTNRWDSKSNVYPKEGFSTPFSHADETASPGYYKVKLANINAQLTATARCAFHKYSYNEVSNGYLAIDLKHGSTAACTIVKSENRDTVTTSGIRIIDSVTIEGWRVSSGWAQEQHVYFYAKFSKPFSKHYNFKDLKQQSSSEVSGTDIRSILAFDFKDKKDLLVKVGISPVSCSGAKLNLEQELNNWNFETTASNANKAWNTELSKIAVKTNNLTQKQMFYTSLYNVLLYPMLYSDVDCQFRGPDHLVHQTTGFNYYAGAIGVWDTFRAAMPLTTILKPNIINEYVQTFLEHYKYAGQLPVWVLAGNETYQMLGIHTLPIITDAYQKGIRNYNIEEAYNAMKVSAMKDTVGYSMGYFVGFKNYKKYGYVPADLEMESAARTLEYSFDDWCLAQMAKALNKTADYAYFSKRAQSYQNIFNKKVGFMNGRFSNGTFRTPFDPFYSSHRKDDFCEGNAWQWTFFVPHDVLGLATLYGEKKTLSNKLDSLFSVSSKLTGDASGDISGLIGQYAHGNEPSHHIPYMYNTLGEPWKTQKIVNQILTTLYHNTPTGISGNEDTGQMSAWYAFSAMGFYPMNPASQNYDIGSPLFKESVIRINNKITFKVSAKNLSTQNIYISKAVLNGKPLLKPLISHADIVRGGTLELTMSNKPTQWGSM